MITGILAAESNVKVTKRRRTQIFGKTYVELSLSLSNGTDINGTDIPVPKHLSTMSTPHTDGIQRPCQPESTIRKGDTEYDKT